MSKAIQCDRCKKCFSPYDLPEGIMYTVFSDFYIQDSKCIVKNQCFDRHMDLNLCWECTKDFYKFMGLSMPNK